MILTAAENQAREFVTVDLATGKVLSRVELTREPSAYFATPDGRTGLVLSPRETPKKAPVIPAELRFLDLTAGAITATVPLEGDPGGPVLAPDGGTITAAQLAPRAITTNAMASAAAGFGTCPPGQHLRGLQANGTVLCEPIGTPPTSVTPVAAIGRSTHPSIAIGTDGLPIISHQLEMSADLRVTKCASRTCQ